MNAILAIFAAIAAVIALLLLWWRHSSGKDIALMAATPTSKATEIAAMAPGSFVEVKGKLRCASPLSGEFSKQPCAYFKAEIYQEETYYDTDSQGKQQRRTRSTNIHSNVQHAACMVEDESGRVTLNLDGVEVEGVQTVNSTEATPRGSTGSGLLDTVMMTLGNYKYNHYETILPPDAPVYLLGEVHPGGVIGKPAKGSANKTFLVSTKSEEERTSDLTSTMQWLLWGAIGLFAIAAALLIWALVKGAA